MALPRGAMWIRATIPLLLSALGVGGVSIDIENNVYKLQESTFDTVVNKFPAVMVMFYAENLPAYEKDYAKAAKKLKKIAPSETAGARLAKVDGAAQPELKKRFDIQAFPTLLVFQGGQLFGQYQSGTDKDDFVAYMKAMATEPAVLGTLLRRYQLGYVAYKELLRRLLPGSMRKRLFPLFPVMCSVPLLAFLLLWGCSRCCSPTKKKKVAAKKGGDAKRAKRSASPAPEVKEGEASGAAQEAKEPKNEEEKKAD